MPRHTLLPPVQNLHLPLPVLSSLPNLYPETLHDPLLILHRKGRQSWTSLCGVVLLSQMELQGCLFGPPGEWGFWSRLMRWGVTRLPIYVVCLVVLLECIESSLLSCGPVSHCSLDDCYGANLLLSWSPSYCSGLPRYASTSLACLLPRHSSLF